MLAPLVLSSQAAHSSLRARRRRATQFTRVATGARANGVFASMLDAVVRNRRRWPYEAAVGRGYSPPDVLAQPPERAAAAGTGVSFERRSVKQLSTWAR